MCMHATLTPPPALQVLEYWAIEDYGDLCRYFLLRKSEICMGIAMKRNFNPEANKVQTKG